MDKNDLKRTISNKLPFLQQRYNVKSLGIFGSVARNEQKRGSDIDILVEFSSPIGFFDFVRLENFLTKTLNQKVDLVSKKALKPTI